MKFQVMNRAIASEYSKLTNIPKTIIISITDVNSVTNTFSENPNILAILHVKFDDVEIGENNCITDVIGKKIITFVNALLNDVNQIIVHCEAGVSRSAGVCAALMKIINNDDWEIFNNPKYCPNMTCYRTILEAYYGSYDETEANKKITHNIQIWRKNNELD